MFVIVLFLAAMYAFMGMNAFAMQFLALLGASTVISTLSFDFMDNGGAFLFALPFTRRQYVAEKYLISYGGGLAGLLLGLVVVAIGSVTGHPTTSDELFPYICVGVLIVVMMVSLMIPLEIKFGSEQSRTALFAVFAAVIIVAVLVGKVLPEAVLARIVVFLMGLSKLQIGCGIGVVAVVLMTISVLLSTHFILKKEF